MNPARAASILGVAAIMACAEPPVSPAPSLMGAGSVTAAATGEQTFVIVGVGEALPSDLATQVQAAGGTLVSAVPEIGVAQATSSSLSFRIRLAKVSGVESVTPDMAFQWTKPIVGEEVTEDVSDAVADAASIGDNETFFSLQWANGAVHAPEAWTAGYTGNGVRVAILDGGLWNRHLDLSGHVDVAASRSFVPGFTFDQDVGTFWHGTHVAGIVGARDNSFGTIGIAPNATLIGVKVLHNGVGNFGAIFNGIIYAATPVAEGGGGANVINMSLGAVFNEKDKATKKDVKDLKKAIDLATKYAWNRGVTVVASSGNGGINLDDEKELFVSPAQNKHVITVSATAPHGWALGATSFADLTRPTYYSNIGKSLVDFAAPGGTDALVVEDGVNRLCTKTGLFGSLTTNCAIFDFIISTTRGGGSSVSSFGFAAGTSMAAPIVSGVAALIIQSSSGLITPAGVRERLLESSEDLGKPGKDELYGHGFVNALRAVQ